MGVCLSARQIVAAHMQMNDLRGCKQARNAADALSLSGLRRDL